MRIVSVGHNTENMKTGKPMGPAGRRSSWLKFLGDAVKGTARAEVAKLRARQTNRNVVAIGGPASNPANHVIINVAKLSKPDTYIISWIRKADRDGIATGTKDVPRAVTVWCATDPLEYLQNIGDNDGSGLELGVLDE